MHNLKVGMTVLILNAPLRWYEGQEVLILSITDTKVVVKVNKWSLKKTIALAPEQVTALDQIKPTTEGPFHTGDLILLHEAAYGQPRDQGQIGKVINAFPTWQKCLVELIEGDNVVRHLYNFHAISLISPERRPSDEDYLRAIAHAVSQQGYWLRYNAWWQNQADKKFWPTSELADLCAKSLEIKSQINAEITSEVERQSHWLMQAFGNLTHAQKVEKWQAEWYSRTEYPSNSNELISEEKLLRAISKEIYLISPFDDISLDEEQDDKPEMFEEHAQDYNYCNSGPELLERCEKYMECLARPKVYAYNSIPFRAISSEGVTATSTLLSYPPTLPQMVFQSTKPLILPKRAQALTLLQQEGKHFASALARLANDADDAAVETLQEKYKTLYSREDYDEIRHYHINNLTLALLATQHKTAINAVLKRELDTQFEHKASEYSIQGLILKGNTHALFWDEENPWYISAHDHIQVAIARVWASAACYLPRFIALLTEYTCGLVLFKHLETNQYSLGYLHLVPFTSYQGGIYRVKARIPTDTNINHLLQWLDQGHLCLLVGHPSRDPNNDNADRLPQFHLPLAIRELYSIHNGFNSAGGYMLEPVQQIERHMSWIDEKDTHLIDRFHARNVGLLPNQFIQFAHDTYGNTFVFDLDCLDERHDPQVANWDHETWKVGERKPFWQWFADFAPESLLGLNKENIGHI